MNDRHRVSDIRALMDPAMAVERAKGNATSTAMLVRDDSVEFIIDDRHSSFPVGEDGSYDFDDMLKSWVSVRGPRER